MEITLEKAKELIKSGEIIQMGTKYIKAIDIEHDRLGRPWLKVKTWLIHPNVAAKNNICNAEGIGYIPLF